MRARCLVGDECFRAVRCMCTLNFVVDSAIRIQVVVYVFRKDLF
jgi:hypothetical protein